MKDVLSFVGGLAAWAVGNLGGALSFLPHAAQVGIQAVGGILAILGVRSAAVNPSTGLQHALDTMGSGWKTITGCIIAMLGYLLSPDVTGTLSPGFAATLQTIGTILAALGVYHAAAKKA